MRGGTTVKSVLSRERRPVLRTEHLSDAPFLMFFLLVVNFQSLQTFQYPKDKSPSSFTDSSQARKAFLPILIVPSRPRQCRNDVIPSRVGFASHYDPIVIRYGDGHKVAKR